MAMGLPQDTSPNDPPHVFNGIGYQPPGAGEEEALQQLQKLLRTPEISDVTPQLKSMQRQLVELTAIAEQLTQGITTRDLSKLKQELEGEMATQSAVITTQLKRLGHSLKELGSIVPPPQPPVSNDASSTLATLKALEQQLQSLQGLPTQLEQLEQLLATLKPTPQPEDGTAANPLEPKAFVKLLIPVLAELFNRKFQQFTTGFNDDAITAIEECLEEKFNAFSERQTMLLKQEFTSIYRQIDQLDAKLNYLSSYLENKPKEG